MDTKTLTVLEFPAILARLAGFTSFSVSKALASRVKPASNLESASLWLKQTSEARKFLASSIDFRIGGAVDVRPHAGLTARGGVLMPPEMLELKATLICARETARMLDKQTATYPNLSAICAKITPPSGLVELISRCISERAEVMDSASPKLAEIRREVHTAHDRILSRLEKILHDPRSSGMLQEGIITQRDGRYVIPLRAEHKGQIKSIIHDQSASGATLFVEPLVVVELNNQWKELQLAERDEERRILAEISSAIGEHAGEIIQTVDQLALFDLILAKAKYAEELDAVEPILHGIEPPADAIHPGSVIKLYHARHPLLDPSMVVPIDFDLDEDTYAVVITGPNTGGKTVTLKLVGLFALMAQSGMHIPAQSGSELSFFSHIFADIGDEQSIEQSLSTFSGHIKNIIHILNKASSQSLVLLDELGAGTDPQEGAALARAILAYLLNKRIPSLIATHYPELKVYAHGTPGVINASLEFDLHTLKPTYHLSLGLPGRSNALSIAERLGLQPEIIAEARREIHPDEMRAEHLLDEIYRQRNQARKAREKADNAKQEAGELERKLASRLNAIEEERRKILEAARKEAEETLLSVEREAVETRRELQKARQPLEVVLNVQDKIDDLQQKIQKPHVRRENEYEDDNAPLMPGQKVHVLSLGVEGVITSLGELEVEVQIGNLRVKASQADIRRERNREADPASSRKRPATSGGPVSERTFLLSGVSQPNPGMELDLRGHRAEDALEKLDRYIESAALTGLPFVRIIHGKGTGTLRQAVREALKQSVNVKRFEAGGEKEGGDGVTIAFLDLD